MTIRRCSFLLIVTFPTIAAQVAPKETINQAAELSQLGDLEFLARGGAR